MSTHTRVAHIHNDTHTHTHAHALTHSPTHVRHSGRLRDLSALSVCTSLVSLVADQNELKNIDSLPELPSLETLSLNKNDVADLDRFCTAALTKFPTVAHVSLLGNPCCPSELSGGTPEQ